MPAQNGSSFLLSTNKKELFFFSYLIFQGVVISLNGQLQNHKTTVSRIASILGDQESATQHLSKCLYTVGFGSNDYINNYLLPQFYPTSRQYPPDQYAAVLIQQYSQKLKVPISSYISLLI